MSPAGTTATHVSTSKRGSRMVRSRKGGRVLIGPAGGGRNGHAGSDPNQERRVTAAFAPSASILGGTGRDQGGQRLRLLCDVVVSAPREPSMPV